VEPWLRVWAVRREPVTARTELVTAEVFSGRARDVAARARRKIGTEVGNRSFFLGDRWLRPDRSNYD